MADNGMVLHAFGEHIAPTGNGFADPESQEGEADFGQDELGNQDRGLREDDTPRLRQDVAAQEVEVRGAETAGGLDKIALLAAEYDGPNQSRGPDPSGGADDGNQEEERLSCGDVERQEGAEGEQEIEPGESEGELAGAHQELV